MRIALAQIRVTPGNPELTTRYALSALVRAAELGASIVVLPEALPLGWTDPSATTMAEPVPGGAFIEAVRAAARTLGIYVASGVVERADDERVYNAAVLFHPDGTLLIHYRKINELDIGHEFYAQGDRLSVARTPIGTLAIAICADAYARNNVITHTLGIMGADIILSPSAWAVPRNFDGTPAQYAQIWLDAYRPVCREHGLWIASASNVGEIPAGPWAGRRCIGNSLLIGPDGEAAIVGPFGVDAETVLVHDIDLVSRPRAWYHPGYRWFEPGSAGSPDVGVVSPVALGRHSGNAPT